MIRRCARGRWSSTSSARWRGRRRRWASTRSSPATATPSPSTLAEMWWSGDIDGIEHVEQSRCRDHYLAWQRERLVAMLHEADVHPGRARGHPGRPAGGRAVRVLEAYDEVPGVLARAARPRGHARDLLELGLGPRTGGDRVRARRLVRHARVVGVGGGAQAAPADLPLPAGADGPRPGGDPLRGRHVGSRRGGTARGGHDLRLPRARRALAGRDPTGRHLRRAGRTARATCAVCSRWWEQAERLSVEGCVRRRGRSGLPRPCGRGRRRTRRA